MHFNLGKDDLAFRTEGPPRLPTGDECGISVSDWRT